MVGWHDRLNGHEFEQTPGDSEGQGSLMCCSPWGHCLGQDLVTATTTSKFLAGIFWVKEDIPLNM